MRECGGYEVLFMKCGLGTRYTAFFESVYKSASLRSTLGRSSCVRDSIFAPPLSQIASDRHLGKATTNGHSTGNPVL